MWSAELLVAQRNMFFKKIMLFATSLNWTEEMDGTRLMRNAFLLILSKRMGS